MDIGFTDEQVLLRETARKFLDSECPTPYVRQRMITEEAVTPEFWAQLAENGWLGITYAEEDGGSGLGLVDLVVLMEEMGRAVMPGPFLATALLGGGVIAEAGSAAQRREFLPQIAEGKLRATLAVTEPNARWDAAGITAAARAERGGFVLSGNKFFVADAHLADVVVVAARTRDGSSMEDGVSLFLVPRGAAGLAIKLLPAIDETRVLDMTVDYAKLRVAFGKPIGSYQGVKHKCADMLIEIENAKSLTYYAAWAVDEGSDEAVQAVSMAKACASDASRKVCAAGIQLHGGIGMTWEHDLHLYLKRAKACEVAFGDATWHRERLARLMTA